MPRTFSHLFSLVSLLVLTSTAALHADVVVWKGTGIQTANKTGVPPSAKVTIYVVVDFDTFLGRIVIAMPETKQVYDEGERSYGINQHPTIPKATFYLTDVIESTPQQGPIEYTHQMVNLNGKVAKVFLRPDEANEGMVPKTLKVLLSKTAGGIFVLPGVVVQGQAVFQTARTQAANSVGKTVAQVSQDIRSELIAGKGYSEIMAP